MSELYTPPIKVPHIDKPSKELSEDTRRLARIGRKMLVLWGERTSKENTFYIEAFMRHNFKPQIQLGVVGEYVTANGHPIPNIHSLTFKIDTPDIEASILLYSHILPVYEPETDPFLSMITQYFTEHALASRPPILD